jgi:tetratricopeptide (TPR) repeat protein
MSEDTVTAWAERVTIPTYRIGEPDKNPMFLDKRVYQGSSGAVYPHPVIDRIYDDRYDREYTALFLENRYLKIMILPELGGRVQMALDKTNGYHFVYYNRVIKPALVGLAGPWISGGIEFNWPQHHRPSTFDPLDWRILGGEDGSQTVWCSEIERMTHGRGLHGFRLYPDRAYLEILVRLANRTPLPQTFLWWANPAVHVDDDYQSVFPPDVHAVMDHGKRAVSTFPIATGVYYNVDYAPGTDISRYKNIPVPTSYMAYHSDFDFLGCYDHGVQAGMLHVANHHVVPGKKQWTWGCGDFGRAWDRQLTDADGPYVELMCGAYTDNQPDFSWLAPGEEKRFTQVFMPYKGIGPAKNASVDAALNLEFVGASAQVGVYVTRPRNMRVLLLCRGEVIWQVETALSPEAALVRSVALPFPARPQEYTLQVLALDDGKRVLVDYTPLPDEKPEVPAPAIAALPPAQVPTVEELYLNGLHLEQYRHATYAPEPYYEEALRRDPLDWRCNNALGRLLLRRGKFVEAVDYFRRSIARLTVRNPNPYDSEPYYNLGLALAMLGRTAEADNAFYKATWDAAWQPAAYFELARLASRNGRPEEALDLAGQARERNVRHGQARHLRIALLRRLGQDRPRGVDEALAAIANALSLDPLDFGALWERRLLGGPDEFTPHAAGGAETYVAVALDYAHAGLYEEAVALLAAAPPAPMAGYYLGWCHLLAGDIEAATRAFVAAAQLSPAYCFPNRVEAVPALEAATRLVPADARAPYYLGNFWYAHRCPADAIACWEAAAALNERFPTVHRNLGLAYYNHLHDGTRARSAYVRAFLLDPADARVFFELDQLDRRLNRAPAERLARLMEYAGLTQQRDDLTLEQVTLLNFAGRPEEAYAELMGRRFHPWEGGEGKVTGQYVTSLVQIARRRLAEGDYAAAIDLLERAQVYPDDLGEGKLYGTAENHIFYWLGRTYALAGDEEQARACYERAASGRGDLAAARYYHDRPPDMVFYQGQALAALGHEDAAIEIFRKMAAYGAEHIDDEVTIDYFAVSLPDFLVFDDDLNRRNRVHCHYLQALGYLGLGDMAAAASHFRHVLTLDAAHLGAELHRRWPDV